MGVIIIKIKMTENPEDINIEEEERKIEKLNGEAEAHIKSGNELNGKAKDIVKKTKKLLDLP